MELFSEEKKNKIVKKKYKYINKIGHHNLEKALAARLFIM